MRAEVGAGADAARLERHHHRFALRRKMRRQQDRNELGGLPLAGDALKLQLGQHLSIESRHRVAMSNHSIEFVQLEQSE